VIGFVVINVPGERAASIFGVVFVPSISERLAGYDNDGVKCTFRSCCFIVLIELKHST